MESKYRNHQKRLLSYLVGYFELEDGKKLTTYREPLLVMDIPEKTGLVRTTCYRLIDAIFDDNLFLDNLPSGFKDLERELQLVRNELELFEIPRVGGRARKAIRRITDQDGLNHSLQEKICKSCIFFNEPLLLCNFIERLLHERRATAADNAEKLDNIIRELKDRRGRFSKKMPACRFYQQESYISCPSWLKRVKGGYSCPFTGCRAVLEEPPQPGKAVTCNRCGNEIYYVSSTVTPYRARKNAVKAWEKAAAQARVEISIPEDGLSVSRVKRKGSIHLTLTKSMDPKVEFAGGYPHVLYEKNGKRRKIPLIDVSTITVREGSVIPIEFESTINDYMEKNRGKTVFELTDPVDWRIEPGSDNFSKKQEKKDINPLLKGWYYEGYMAFLYRFPLWWQAIIQTAGEGNRASNGKRDEKEGRRNKQVSDLARLQKKLFKLKNSEAGKSWQAREVAASKQIVEFRKKKTVELCRNKGAFESLHYTLVIPEASQKKKRYVKAKYLGSIARAHDCYTCLVNGVTFFVRKKLIKINISQGLGREMTSLFFHKPRVHPHLGSHLDVEEYSRTILKIHVIRALARGEIDPLMFTKCRDTRAGYYYKLHHEEIAEEIAKRVFKQETSWLRKGRRITGDYEEFHHEYAATLAELLKTADVTTENLPGPCIPLPAGSHVRRFPRKGKRDKQVHVAEQGKF